MSKKEVDIFDILPPEAFAAIDELGYNFLKEQGYDTEGAADSEEKRKEIKNETVIVSIVYRKNR